MKKIDNNKMLAPVAIFTYNRLKNTRETIEALENNYLSEQTEVFIFSDGPKTKKDEKKVSEIREYLKFPKRFKKTTIIEREENFYIEKNIVEGVTEIINKYGKIIVLEDDGVTSKGFLKFMNRALNFYEKYEKVMHIATFVFIKMPMNYKKTFFLQYAENTGGGWATWKNRWDKFIWFKSESEGLSDLTEKQKKIIELDGIRNSLKFLQYNPIPWDICWNIAIIKNNGLSVNSPRPLIRNNGLYGGVHFTFINKISGKNNFDIKINKNENINQIIFDNNLIENIQAKELLKNFYINLDRLTIRQMIVNFILKILVALKITKILKKMLK